MQDALSAYSSIFRRARERIEGAEEFNGEWICKTGVWPDWGDEGVVLKLLKAHWSNDAEERIGNASGIFFSVWMERSNPTFLKYNIHAFKLRGLRNYRLESRKFASEFRAAFSSNNKGWPNLRTDFGPQTLMEGFQETNSDACEDTVVDWSERFLPMGDLIDELLLKSRK